MASRYVKLDASGDPGINGHHGHNGHGPGAHGSDAGPATKGGEGGHIDSTLATAVDDENVSWQLTNTRDSKAKSIPAVSGETIPVSSFGGLLVRAQGAPGGRGGNGGDGRQGYQGSKGRDATKGVPRTGRRANRPARSIASLGRRKAGRSFSL